MFKHECKMGEFDLLGERKNPLSSEWNSWTLVICRKCKKIREWQVHSEQEMHGSELSVTAFPGMDYLQHRYNLTEIDVQAILKGTKKPTRYNDRTNEYYEET